MTDSNEGSCYIAMPRTMWTHKEEHGVWDVVKGLSNEGIRTFDSVSQAKEFAESPNEECAGRNYFIVRVLG